MLLLAMLHAAGVQVPLAVAPVQEILPEEPSAHAQAAPASMLLLAMLHATAMQVPLAFAPVQEISPE